ncbi:profilin, required for normal timing of actin polymerization in response to thermal stress [Mortierella sp. AD011]|nr:profilin, required for normal timing of actin polymerization in response to thermal stress [Mortierella sp. AD010]KAF9403074.1 profilin, required for normal timing of actin polymerization in response to thermal stress [Mortierella sp. AD011]
MSWQEYVNNQLVGTGKVKKAAIFGHDGSLWAGSPDFKVGAAEAQKLIKAFQDPKDILTDGFYLEGTKYVLLRYDDKTIYARHGQNGVACVKTGQTVLIGYYGEGMQAGDCNEVVAKLADYLNGAGY